MKKGFLLSLFIMTLLVLAACGSSDADNKENNKGDATYSGGDLKIAVSAQPPTLDPQLTTATVALDVARNIFETLVSSDENFETKPMLAESVEMSEDGLTYTFKLREGVKFHNGKEMTSEDVEASMNRWLGLSSRAKMLLEGAEFKAIDEYTVELILAEVASDTLDIMAGQGQFPAIMPKAVVEAAGEDGIKEYIGTGPFKYEEWKQDQYIKLVKYDDYALVDEPASGYVGKKEALVDNLYYYIVTDSSTRLAGIQTGEYHVADSMPYDNYEMIKATGNLETYAFLDGSLNMVYNKKEGIMSNPKMRQAINAVIDAEAVMLASFADPDLYELNHSYMNPEQVTWETTSGSDAYNQKNLELAKQLAEEAGYNGEEIRLYATRDYDYYYNAAIVVKEELEQAGFNVKLEIFDWPTLMQKRDDAANWDVFFTGTGYITTPSQLLVLGESYAGWTNDDTIDELLVDIRSSLTQEEVKENWEKLQAHLWDEYLPTTIFGNYKRIVATSDNLQGFKVFNGIIPWNVSVN